MQADKFCGPDAGLGQATDGQGRGVGGEHAARRHQGFCLLGDLRFEGAVFKHRFNHQVAAMQILQLRRGVYQRQHLRLLGLAHALLRNPLVGQLAAVVTPPLGFLQTGVSQHAGNAFHGVGISNASPHHAGAQDTHLGRFPRRKTTGSGFTCLDGIEVEEKRSDHVLGGLPHHHLGQLAALDTGGGVVINLGPLDHALQNGLCSGIQTMGFVE